MTIILVRLTMGCVLTAARPSTLAATFATAAKVSEFHRVTTSLALVRR